MYMDAAAQRHPANEWCSHGAGDLESVPRVLILLKLTGLTAPTLAALGTSAATPLRYSRLPSSVQSWSRHGSQGVELDGISKQLVQLQSTDTGIILDDQGVTLLWDCFMLL